ncbi:hypothetical protein Q3G72_029848 [Acer saccharum]|nr:hypothetical protein Q3G72_029848 [Acer saccharum]
MLKVKGIETIRIDIELLPLKVVPVVEIGETKIPIESLFSSINGSPSMRTYSEDFVFISTDDEDSEAVNSEMFASEDDEDYIPCDGNAEEVETSVSSNSSQSKANSSENDFEDDQLSDAASFDWDHDFLIEVSSDEEDGGTNSNVQSMRGMAFKCMSDERVRLEVGELFNNLHHFRQILRHFAVQEGFELQRIKIERERFTAQCAATTCS